MLDPRVYRAGWLPLLLAVVVVAFSLRPAPHGATSTLSAQVFDGRAAVNQVAAWSASPAFADPRPGSAQDVALGRDIARQLRRQGFRVRSVARSGHTALGQRTLTTMLGERPGISDDALVIAADRSSLTGARSDLAASGALVELARILGGRSLDKTLVLASVSGGPGGAGTAALARELNVPVDAVLVLGALGAGADHRPWVVPFSDSSAFAPYGLRQTVAAAVRAEVGPGPGAPGVLQQFGRLAFPLTLGAQGPLLARGMPAVLLSSAGERGPGASDEIRPAELASFGRAALRTATALDGAAAPAPPSRYLVVAGQILEPWTVRLVTGALLIPLLLAVIDGLARVRRRRGQAGRWTLWALAGVTPFLLAGIVAWLCGLAGLTGGAPPAAVGAGVVPLDGRAVVALVLVLLALVGGWLGLRRLLLRLAHVPGRPDAPGAAAAAAALGLVATGALWVANPYAAALVAPGLHVWLLVTAPETRPRRSLAVSLALLGALPAVLVALGYAVTFGLGPVDLAWTGLLAVAGGAVGPLAALAWCAVLGAFGSVLAIAAVPRPDAEAVAPVTVRGPRTYAGPGSLGGTESALRR